MYSTPNSLLKKTGKYRVDRFTYLKQLADEYLCVNVQAEKKEQVLANLANFAYDPINYEYFRRLNILDIFINNLKEFQTNQFKYISSKTLNFSLAGICNACLELKNKEYLCKNGIVDLVKYCLFKLSNDEEQIESILIIITTLIFMFEERLKLDTDLISCVQSFASSSNKRLSNVSLIFLNDYCK